MHARVLFPALLALAACKTGSANTAVKDDTDPATPQKMFDEIPNVFGPEKCPSPGCWTNYMRVTDLDADGDLDVIAVNYADFFGGNAKKQPLALFLNDGQATFTDGSGKLANFSAELRQVAIADINGDGFPDIYAPNGRGNADAFFVSDGQGGFKDEAATRVAGKKSRAGAVRYLDADLDGDLDLYIADGYAKGAINTNIGTIWLNDGQGVFKQLEGAITGTIKGNDIDDVDIIDADNDFDPDILVNPHNNGNVALLVNDGSGKFAVDPAAVGPAPGSGNHYDPAVCDFNKDGYLDVYLDNIGGGYNELLLINDKTGKFVDQTATVVGNDNGEDDNGVVCADVDQDGSMDAVIISLYEAGERLMLNDGQGKLTYRPGAFAQFQDGTLWGEFGDLNGDGRIDFVTSQGESGNMQDRAYLANQLVPVDDRAPTFRAVEKPQNGRMRFAVVDRDVSDEGPRLSKAWAKVKTADGEKEVAATFVGGDLFMVKIPDGSTAVAACAKDRAGNEACGDPQAP